MAEAMAVAGLASTIITFIDASVKLASVCKEFYSNCGELPKELGKCQKLTDEFYLWISDLQRSLSVQNPMIQPTEADVALQNVIVKCVDECRAFQELLAGLLPAVKVRNQMGARLVALKSAVSAMHKEGKIKRLQQSLEGLKNDLRLCIGERTMRLSEQALKQNERILEVGEMAMNIQTEGQKEIVAYMVDHRTRLEDMSNKLGWLEVDLQQTDRKSDELLLLVRELASSVNSKNDNTAIICISIPRSLYNPSLSIYNGFRAYTNKLPMPGGWVPTIWDFRPFYNRDNQIPSRVAFISIASNNAADEELEFHPKKVDSEIIFSNSQFYHQQQGWLSWLMCLEHADTVIYPITKPKAITSGNPNSYKVWGEAMKTISYEPSSTTQLDLDVDTLDTNLPELPDAISREAEMFKDQRNSQELKSDDQAQQMGILRRRTFPKISARSTFNTFLDMKYHKNRAWGNDDDSTGEPAVPPRPRCMSSGSILDIKALRDLERREEKAALRRRAVSTFTASAVNESSSAAEFTRIPQATFTQQNTTIQDIDEEFLQQQRRREDDVAKAQEITKRLQSTGVSDDAKTLEEIQAVMKIIATANANSFSTLSESNLKNLHEIITTDASIEDSAKKPFNWGVKLVEKQDYAKLFMWQFFIGTFSLYLFEPWNLSFYCSLKTALHEFLITSRISYHGNISFPLLVLYRTIIAYANTHMPILCLDYLFGRTEDEPAQLTFAYFFFVISLGMNLIGIFAVDFGGFKFHFELLLDIYWKLMGAYAFLLWWIISAKFRIKLGDYDLSHWNVWFLLLAIFLLGDSFS